MPPANQLFDGLWQCLCPYLSTLTKKRLPSVLSPALRSLIPCLSTPGRQIHAQSFHRVAQAALRSVTPILNLRGHRFIHQKPLFSALELRDQGRIRNLDIRSAYQELRKVALRGAYAQIQECVRILVKERGEKPNLRLYDALLLANTDPEHGSPQEVAELLEEMANDGLNPDSATYHAVLRVRSMVARSEVLSAYSLIGTRCPSRLPLPASYPRRASRTLVLPN